MSISYECELAKLPIKEKLDEHTIFITQSTWRIMAFMAVLIIHSLTWFIMSSGVLVPQLDCKLFESKDLSFISLASPSSSQWAEMSTNTCWLIQWAVPYEDILWLFRDLLLTRVKTSSLLNLYQVNLRLKG